MLTTSHFLAAYVLLFLALLHTAHAFSICSSGNNAHWHIGRPRAGMRLDMTTPADDQKDALWRGGEPELSRNWRLERARLDHQHSLEVRRRKPRHLPYPGASAFAMTLGLSTKEEWDEWLELGEGRTSYCPSDPEAYYRSQGCWISCRRWLKVQAVLIKRTAASHGPAAWAAPTHLRAPPQQFVSFNTGGKPS